MLVTFLLFLWFCYLFSSMSFHKQTYLLPKFSIFLVIQYHPYLWIKIALMTDGLNPAGGGTWPKIGYMCAAEGPNHTHLYSKFENMGHSYTSTKIWTIPIVLLENWPIIVVIFSCSFLRNMTHFYIKIAVVQNNGFSTDLRLILNAQAVSLCKK